MTTFDPDRYGSGREVGELAIIPRLRVMDWAQLLSAARRLAFAEEPWVSASEASEYGLDLLAGAEFRGLSEQQRKILLMHGEMWLTQPRWDRSQLLALLIKQLRTYLLFGLPEVEVEVEDLLRELESRV